MAGTMKQNYLFEKHHDLCTYFRTIASALYNRPAVVLIARLIIGNPNGRFIFEAKLSAKIILLMLPTHHLR